MREFLGKMVKKCVKSSTLFQLFKKWFAACLDTCFPKERRHYFRVKGSLFLHIQQQQEGKDRCLTSDFSLGQSRRSLFTKREKDLSLFPATTALRSSAFPPLIS